MFLIRPGIILPIIVFLYLGSYNYIGYVFIIKRYSYLLYLISIVIFVFLNIFYYLNFYNIYFSDPGILPKLLNNKNIKNNIIVM